MTTWILMSTLWTLVALVIWFAIKWEKEDREHIEAINKANIDYWSRVTWDDKLGWMVDGKQIRSRNEQ